MEHGQVFYAQHDGLVVFKLVGQIRYTMGASYRLSASLDAFLDQLFEEKSFENVLIDLTEMESIDSTNLGLLAKITQFTQQHFGRKATIVSTNPDINEILESVGFDQVFIIVQNPQQIGVDLEQLPDVPEPDKQLARLVLDAHKALIDLSEENRAMFRNLVNVLEEQVKKYE